MRVDNLKKYIKRTFKRKISITYGIIIALILGSGMYTKVSAADFGKYTYVEEINSDNGDTIPIATANNYGTIKNIGNFRIAAEGIGAEAVNKGKLDTGFNGYTVMKGSSGATITNEGRIDVKHNNGVAMYVDSGATAINTESGIINLKKADGIGMYATGTGSTIENRGKIYLYGSEETTEINEIGIDSKGNIGMKIENGAAMLNKGQIVFKGKER